ncbi:hypothetical protein D3C85_555620 [compost metagenome]
MLTFIPSRSPGGLPVSGIGQIRFDSSQQFIVPEEVHSLSAVCVGPGAKQGASANNRMGGGGGGGGLVWANDIPVQPGDVIDVVVGLSSQVTAVHNVASLIVTSISKNGVLLMSAMSGRIGRAGSLALGAGPGGFGGTFFVDPSITDFGGGIGGQGGTGGISTTGGTPTTGAGGGAAGYAGDGGQGGTGGSGNTNSSGKGKVGTGGAGGGGWTTSSGVAYAAGGGVGLQGRGEDGLDAPSRGANGLPGSSPGPFFGRGLSAGITTGADGGARIIWGNGRKFPATNTQDM